MIVTPISLQSPRSVREVQSFLQEIAHLPFDPTVDQTVVIRDQDRIVATASRTGEVFQYIAVAPEHQGENLTAALLNHLMQDAFREGIYHYFIYTKPEMAPLFERTGFRLLVAHERAALLEGGSGRIEDYLAELQKKLGSPRGPRGALLMNLNPMTLGHLWLIGEARRRVEDLVVFLVTQDLSVVPFQDRLAVARSAVGSLPGVTVLPGGPYMISRATFPTYFLKKKDEELPAYTHTDALLFGRYIAPALGITDRFLGEEPLDPVTRAYNEALEEILPPLGTQVHVLQRVQKAGTVISASRVRHYLAQGALAAAFDLIPEATKAYLRSPKGQQIVQKIKESEADRQS
ncbi:[Citrate [pro-3S]-lyase] ligase [Clostridiaceae bacterium JG1575]|nr:[Citrate [pro-3S]-lyase] ligase [Clostridiaceae bacterium JG1575]